MSDVVLSTQQRNSLQENGRFGRRLEDLEVKDSQTERFHRIRDHREFRVVQLKVTANGRRNWSCLQQCNSQCNIAKESKKLKQLLTANVFARLIVNYYRQSKLDCLTLGSTLDSNFKVRTRHLETNKLLANLAVKAAMFSGSHHFSSLGFQTSVI